MHCLVRLYWHMTTDLFVSQASFEPRTCFSNLDSYFMGGSFSESRYWWPYFNKRTDRSHEIILKGTANRSWSFHKNRDKDIEAVPLFSLHRSLHLASGKWKQPHPHPIQQQGSGLHPVILDIAEFIWKLLLKNLQFLGTIRGGCRPQVHWNELLPAWHISGFWLWASFQSVSGHGSNSERELVSATEINTTLSRGRRKR